MLKFVILIFFGIDVIFGDVYHFLRPAVLLEPPLNYGDGYNYEPVLPSTSTAPTLPEIIINRNINNDNFNQGYIYEKPNITFPDGTLFPPQSDEVTISNEYLPSQNFPPQSDEIPNVPSTYLPPPIRDPSSDYLPPNNPSNDYLPPKNQKDLIITKSKGTKSQKKDGEKKEKSLFIGSNIVRTVNEAAQNGYIYPQPSFPPQFDDFLPPDQGYIYNSPPPLPPVSSYLPPTSAANKVLKDSDFFQTSPNSPLRLELNELKCLPQQGGYFKSVITVQSFLDSIPVVDVDVVDSRCDIKVIRSQLVINILAEDFQKCGIAFCGQDLCLRVRFPQIRGMKTINDAILTLQCKTQDRVVTKTHAIRLGISNDNQGRAGSTYAQGGSQQPFRTQIGLFRRAGGIGTNTFTRALEPGGTVQLGEDLMLRAHVKFGDGWNYTRISDISLQRIAPSGEVTNSAILVTSAGCVNPSMRSICPLPPVFEQPLGYRFGFRAIMFQGMRSGDEMIMNVRIAGCMDQRDCHIDTTSCERTKKVKRNTDKIEQLSEVSKISFRVEFPETVDLPLKRKTFPPIWSIIGIALGCVGLLILVFIVYVKKRKIQNFYPNSW